MMKTSFGKGKTFRALAVSTLAFFALALVASAATTISANIVTDGNLTVNGNSIVGDAALDTVTVNGVLQGASPLVFEGLTANDFEMTFAVPDVTADATITFPSATSTLATLAGTETFTNKTLTAPTINTGVLSGGTIDNMVIGGTTAVAGTFTALTTTGDNTLGNAVTDDLTITAAILGASPLVLDGLTDDTFEATIALGADPTADITITLPSVTSTLATLGGTETLTGKTLSAPTINTMAAEGGTINNAVIGGSTAAAGTFTTLSVTANGTLGDSASLDSQTMNGDVTINFGDNELNQLDIQQGTDNYININTTNAAENISFGNAATNPTYSFLGTSAVTIAGSADGTNALVLTLGDIEVTNGDLDVVAGDFNVTLDAADEVDLTKTAAAAATEEGLDITFTSGAGDGLDVYSALRVAATSANHAASSDKVYGLNIANLASADAEGDEVALFVGTGWDNIIDSSGFDVVNTTGATTITGSVEGTAALTLTAGDIVLTSGDLVMTGEQMEIPDNSATAFTLEDSGTGLDYLAIVTTDGAETMVLGHSTVDSITLTADGTADGTDLVLPPQGVNGSEMLNNTVTETQLAATITFADADLVDFGSNVTSATEGLLLPKHATNCTTATAEGQVCWQADTNVLYIGDGAAATQAIGNTAAANTWTDNQIYTFLGNEDIAITSDLGAAVNILSITATPNAADFAVQGIKIDLAASANAFGLDAAIEIDNSDDSVAIPDGVLFTSAGGAITDAIDATATQIVNALNVGTNVIAITTGTIGSNAATLIDFLDFDVDADGLLVFASDGAGDQISMTSPAADWQALVIDAATADSTNATGLIQLTMDTVTASANALSVDFQVGDAAASSTYIADELIVTIDADAVQTPTVYGKYVSLTVNEDTAVTYGLAVEQQDAGTQLVTAGLLIDNLDTAQAMTDGILLRAAAGAMTDAIDASDAEILNALNVGANTITGGAAVIDFTGFDVAATTGATVIAGSAEGTAALTLTAGDAVLTDGDMSVAGGNIIKSAQVGVTAFATGGQASAVQITADLVEVAVTATAGDSVKLPAAAAGLSAIVTNHGVASMDLFPATGDAINEGAANAQKAVAVNATVLCYAYDATNWECLTLAR